MSEFYNFRIGERVNFCDGEGISIPLVIREGQREQSKHNTHTPAEKLFHTDDLHRWTKYSPLSNNPNRWVCLIELLESFELLPYLYNVDWSTFTGPTLTMTHLTEEEADCFVEALKSLYKPPMTDGTYRVRWEYK